MKKFANKISNQGFTVLSVTLAPVALSLLTFAFTMSDASPLEIYIKYPKMLEYIMSALLLSVAGGFLADMIFRYPK